jgi:phage terminase small subunit
MATKKQEKFVEAMLEGKRASQAAVAAGYSHASAGATVARQREVQAALARGRAELAEISTIRRVDVLDGLMEAIDLGRSMEDPQAMIGGWREIAKILGYYAPETKRIELTGEQNQVLRKFEQLSDADLLDMLRSRSLMVDAN